FRHSQHLKMPPGLRPISDMKRTQNGQLRKTAHNKAVFAIGHGTRKANGVLGNLESGRFGFIVK
ncbi:MAG: hypothetical protein D6712_02005, partial [Chloroflexi bacterium]